MREARDHVAVCQQCSAELESIQRIDAGVSAVTALPCTLARDLRSALFDRELTADEVAVATTHLAGCASCREEQSAWLGLEATLHAMPAAVPSHATDARIAALVADVRTRRPVRGPVLRPLALRGAAVATIVASLLFGLLPGAGPEVATPAPVEQQALVAGVQQVLLYSPTNTLYVAQPAASAVDALDASSYALRARIAIGGRPTALALNEFSSRVLVLNGAERSVVEIDPQSNEVVSTTEISVGGTPTSMQVEPGTGKIIVAAVADVPGTNSGPRPTATVGAIPEGGLVAVLDPTLKKVETVRTLDAAPSQILTEADGKRTLLISRTSTTILDASLNKLGTLPGGLAGAFGVRGTIAVLSSDAGAAVVTLLGDGAPRTLRVPGKAASITPLPDGTFAVLVGDGASGRIVLIDETGAAVGVTPVDQGAGDLTYDPASKRFAVANDGKLWSAALPAGIARLPEQTVPASASPRPAASTPSASGAPVLASASPSATPSAPAAAPSASAPVAALPQAAAVPPSAVPVGPDVYRLATRDGRLPLLVASTPGRTWFVDQHNTLNALNTLTGEMFAVAQLPASAQIRFLAADASHVYAVDPTDARLYSFAARSEKFDTRERIPLLQRARSLAVSDSGTVWVGLAGEGDLLAIDGATGTPKLLVSTGLSSVTSLTTAGADAVWFTDGTNIGRLDANTSKIALAPLRADGAAHMLLADRSGTLWVGTTAGEVFRLSGGSQTLVTRTTRAVSGLAADRTGAVWALAPSALSAQRSDLLPLAGGGAGEVVPGPVFGLTFTSTGRAWIADASGGFYIVVEGEK